MDGTWSLSRELFGQLALYVIASMLMGVAFGVVLLSSPVAIVLYFLMPMGAHRDRRDPVVRRRRAVAGLVELRLDPGRQAAEPTEWAHAGTTLAGGWSFPSSSGSGASPGAR